MPTLAEFIESLNQEQDKLVQMSTIKYSKDQSLVAGFLNLAIGKKKSKDLKQQTCEGEEAFRYRKLKFN